MQFRRRTAQRVAGVLTFTYAAATILALAGLVTQRSGHHTASWVERIFELLNVPVAHSLVSVVALAIITGALLRRKRIGLLIVLFFQLVGIYVGIALVFDLPVWVRLTGFRDDGFTRAWNIASVPVALAIMAVLWLSRAAFRGRLRKGSFVAAAITGAIGVAVTLAVTWVALRFTAPPRTTSAIDAIIGVIAGSLGLRLPTAVAAHAPAPRLVMEISSILLGLTLLAAVLVFLRTTHPAGRWSPDHELTLRELVRSSPDSLAYFATRRDKESIVSPHSDAAVTYRVLQGVSIAAGDPLGEQRAWPDVIERWRHEAAEYGWIPAVIGASAAGARAYAESGLRVFHLGDEAVLDAASFTLTGPSRRDLRRAVQRARREGLTVTARRQAQINADELETLRTLIDDWRHGDTERGFSMALNRVGDPADPTIVWVCAHDADGRVHGVLTFVPWTPNGLSLDVMRRSPDAPNGVTELMVSELREQCGDLGVRKVSLNFCMFRTAFAGADELGANPMTRLNGSVLGVLDRVWQLERLYRSNRRYHPEWVPRYVCFADVMALPQTVLAIGQAEGFLPAPFAKEPTHRLPAAAVERARELATAPIAVAADLAPKRSEQSRVRISHVEALTAAGIESYPAVNARPTTNLAELERTWVAEAAVTVVGRVRAIRNHGGVVFLTLTDGLGTVQVATDRAAAGLDGLRRFAKLVDIGDLILVRGRCGTSRTSTPTVLVDSWEIQAKCLHPLAFTGWADPESRVRRRSEDLITRPAGVRVLELRSRAMRAVRTTLEAEGFAEVETPVLQPVHGGASARPFVTHINAYDTDLYLRIAPELYLKRLLVGGMGRIFEMSRNFRNEGVDATHNPEFTSLEAYQPYADYDDMRLLTQRIVRAAAKAATGREVLTLGEDEFDLSGDWAVVSVLDAVSHAVGEAVSLDDPDRLLALADSFDLGLPPGSGPGAILEELYGELVEPRTIAPTFYVDFPAETSPLTRRHRSKPGLVERWDLVVNGMELGTAYTELTDPFDQRARFTEQSLKAAAGDLEAMQIDEDFLRALEIGMPPTGGLGIGMDRLVMLLTGQSIRGVLTFPFVRPLG
ncbi:MAG: bifunctional lysylphosphatidylglycerol synthetase/lysine--tRNA ligase LysX [Propionibacteriaceae bacterium]|nr:bifunctional lysylphosphatidylglycerol synthetase/lysine--tRNA ligase LysX [Propionibacteriaceae bacterium]